MPRVKIIDPMLRERWGDYSEVPDESVDRGVRNGKWKLEKETYPDKSMDASGPKQYDVKEAVPKKAPTKPKPLTRKDVHGKRKK